MPLVFGAIAPHGGDAIAEIADDPAVMAKTRAGLEELGRRCVAAQPETLVVLNPHGMVMRDTVSIGFAETAAGALGTPPREVYLEMMTDIPLIEAILLQTQASALPVTPVAARIDEESDTRIVPLDWGALVPLWFLARPMNPMPRLVVLAPDRRLPREMLVRIGLSIARAADATGKRVGLIASCDQGHAHSPNGPYGYSPVSALHDKLMCDTIAANDLPALLDGAVWTESFLEEAKVDAYWQTIMLAGALGHTPMHGELLSYEAPTYFGMAVAAYTPEG